MKAPTSVTVETPDAHKGLPERRYLPELHGVRGLALLGVVLFHLFGAGRVSGGIDIFLAISGFLFTGMLLREAAVSGGRLDWIRYLGRLVRRILAPAAIVVGVTLFAGLTIFPVTRHSQLWAEARASLLYFENFELINSQLAYGAAGPETSPFQHFWSLSIQGQFYLVWPLVAILSVLIAKAVKASPVQVMAVTVGLILVGSFAYAIYMGNYNQDEAYLMTTTRAWQLAFGGLLALAGNMIRLPRPYRASAGWLGIGLIVSCGVVLDGAALFPGAWALWPLAGLTLVLMSTSRTASPETSASRFLSNKALAWIGDHAYGLYLWHWPVLIYYIEVRGRDTISIWEALLLLAITTALAILTYKWVEQPLKTFQYSRSSPSVRRINKILIAVAGVGLLVAATGSTLLLMRPQSQPAIVGEEWDWEQYPGAMAATADHADIENGGKFLPNGDDLTRQRSTIYLHGCVQKHGNSPGSEEVTVCEDPHEPENADKRIVLSGGSHTLHWHSAWELLARKHNWELLVVNKDACVFMATDDPEYTACNTWNENYIDWLHEQDVDLVVANGTRIYSDSPEVIEQGAQQRWREISDTDTTLLLMRGTPRPGERVDDCLASGSSAVDCGATLKYVAPENPLTEIDLPQNTYVIDLLPYVCPEGTTTESTTCPAVVGNVAVWYDGSHLTNQYVATMAPILESYLEDEVSWLF